MSESEKIEELKAQHNLHSICQKRITLRKLVEEIEANEIPSELAHEIIDSDESNIAKFLEILSIFDRRNA